MSGERGGVILIAGPDGAGKSSVADALAAGLFAGRDVVRVHQRARLLPTHTHHQGPVVEPHADRPYAAWLSILKVFYLYVDVCLGWLLRIRPIARRGGWVLLERGWWDLAVDPRRYRLSAGSGLVRSLGRIVPRPTLVLILEGPPSLIRARSTELPEEEVARQSAMWRTVLPPGCTRTVLDVSLPLEVVIAAAADAVVGVGGAPPSTPGDVDQLLGEASDTVIMALDPATPSARGQAGPRSYRLLLAPITLAKVVVRRAGWGFADQALSSLTNFLVGFVVARSVGPEAFGAYALAFAVYVLVLNISRAVGSLPLTIRFSVTDPGSWRSATAQAGALSLLMGAAAGAACLGVSFLASGTLREAFLALAVVLPGLILQDLWRYAFFARHTGVQAFANDGIWVLVQVPLFLLLLLSGHFSVGVAILAWGGSATVAAVAGCLQAGVTPEIGRALGWWRAQRDIAARFLGEALVSTGAATVQPYGITAVSGLAAVGTLAAGEVLLGPFNVIFQGTNLVAIPEGARLLRVSPGRLMQACLLWATALAGAAAAWALVVLLLPEDIGVAILRQNWIPARSVLLPMAIALVGLGATAGATIGIRVLAAASRSLRTRTITTSMSLVGAIAGAIANGAIGAATAMAITSWLGVVIWWWQFRRALAEHRSTQGALDGERDEAVLAEGASVVKSAHLSQGR